MFCSHTHTHGFSLNNIFSPTAANILVILLRKVIWKPLEISEVRFIPG